MVITTAQGAVDLGYSGTQRPIVQNLGPGVLYIGSTSSNLLTEGIQVPVNAAYELPDVLVGGAGRLYAQASGDSCDVRTLNVG
jgi:hypothetical protein